MDADSYFMVLSNVLRGQDWKGSIDQFCETHMELFDFDGEEDDEWSHAMASNKTSKQDKSMFSFGGANPMRR